MKKFVINLESRRDRRDEMERQLNCIGWTDVQFFPAIRPEDRGGFVSIGARGCFNSHLRVIEEAKEQAVLILEDDLNFADEFPEKWDHAMRDLPSDWSIFYPAHYLDGAGSGVQALAPEAAVLCAHFLAINSGAIGLIADELRTMLSREPGDPRGGPMHVDGAYSTIRRLHPELKTYAHFPSLGYQRSSTSDITPPQKERHFLRPLRAGLRRFDRLVRLKRRLMGQR